MEVYKTYEHKPTVVKAYRATREDVIKTLEGEMKVHPGDYVVKGSKGEFYPVNKEIFNELYEEVNNEI